MLVTAGPTREPIDAVRFITNRSSGKMGFAVAACARDRGHEVVLLSGPVSLPAPEGVRLVRVTTAREMLDAALLRIRACDALVMCAAVADHRPSCPSARKLRKTEIPAALPLEPTPDILSRLAASKEGRIFVGFAAETENLLDGARRKLVEKKLDLIVANDVSRPDSGFDSDYNAAALVPARGKIRFLPLMPKSELAGRVIEWVERTARRRSRRGVCRLPSPGESSRQPR